MAIDTPNSTGPGWIRAFIHFLTFVNQPIKRRFTLFFIGVLWWFLVMTILSVGSMIMVKTAISEDSRQLQPTIERLSSIATELGKLQLYLRTYPERGNEASSGAFVAGILPLVHVMSLESRKLKPEPLHRINTSTLKKGITAMRETALQMADSLEPHPLDSQKSFLKLRNTLLVKVNRLLGDTQTDLAILADLREQRHNKILGIVSGAATGSISVLVIATFLLALFTYYIRKAIGRPISSLIRQVEALVEGNSDLNARIRVASEDEIGILTHKLNLLTEKLHSLSVFKRVIEEDPGVHDVYIRLGEVFRKLGLEDFTLYEVNKNDCPVPVYPDHAPGRHVEMDRSGRGGTLCRAVKSNRMITSMDFAGICSRVCKEMNQDHACIPIMFSSGSFMIAQFVFEKVPRENQEEVFRNLRMASNFLDASRNVLESKKLMNELRENAIRDTLTGLYNRRFLTEIMESIVPGIRRRGGKLGVVMCDIDHFKEINDQHGHDAGDIVLKGTAEVLNRCRRASDIIIRYGGEEFVIIFRDMEKDDPYPLAERIRTEFSRQKIRYGKEILMRTISLGISVFPDDTDDIWEAIRLADEALFQAKNSGRNRTVRYGIPPSDDRVPAEKSS
ncbi:MAG: diguanylate cyclase [Acidobacteria bacterium]|nr:diguanylate cyclase [Acidobacteriota bacterium]